MSDYEIKEEILELQVEYLHIEESNNITYFNYQAFLEEKFDTEKP